MHAIKYRNKERFDKSIAKIKRYGLLPQMAVSYLLTLCGITSQKTHRGGLGLSGLVHEEAHPSFPYSA